VVSAEVHLTLFSKEYIILFDYFLRTNTMDVMTVSQAAKLWGITRRRVLKLCENGQLPEAEKVGAVWVMPKSTVKPPDGRLRENRTGVRPSQI
jgi:excisionase family DNA binding protein